MQIIGFHFTKINAEKLDSTKDTIINTHIDFTDLDKDKMELFKDQDILQVLFNYSITYTPKEDKKATPPGSIALSGKVIISADKEESKEVFKFWKKKELPPSFQVPVYNLILRKCSLKAANLQEDIDLPLTLPLPKVQPA